MFTSIRANAFLRWELRQHSAARGINWSFILMRVIPLSFLTLVALIPTQYYINDNRVDWLLIMAIILFLPRPILAIRTIFVGIQSVRHDMIQDRWELLILTGIPVRRIVWRKWIKVVRQTFPDYLLFALPSIGLALGISQFFMATVFMCGQGQSLYPLTDLYNAITILFHPYCYNNIMFYYGSQFNPSSVVFGIGILLIVSMALFETGLNASVGVLAGFSHFTTKGLGILYGVITRCCLLCITFLAIPLMQAYIKQSFDCYHLTFIETFTCQAGSYQILRTIYRVTDTIEVAVMPLLDQGTLLAANVMRPNDDRMLRIYVRPPKYEPSKIIVIKNSFDNRPFVLRNIIAALISAFFYFLLIRYFLRRATRLAIVNHGASGYLEL